MQIKLNPGDEVREGDTMENGSFLEGNGIIILILFFIMMMGGGFGWGGGANNAAVQGALTYLRKYLR